MSTPRSVSKRTLEIALQSLEAGHLIQMDPGARRAIAELRQAVKPRRPKPKPAQSAEAGKGVR